MNITTFENIGHLLTLEGAVLQAGRQPDESHLGIVSDAAMVVGDQRILWAGPQKELASFLESSMAGGAETVTSVQRVSLEDCDVLPGFVESHSHCVFGGDRCDEFELRNRGVSYQQIGQQGGGILSTVRATREASAEELTQKARKFEEDFLKQGVTTLETKSGYGLNKETELKMLRVISQLDRLRVIPTFLGAHAIPKEKSEAAYLKELQEEVLPLVAKEKLASRVDIFIEKGYFTSQHSLSYLKAAKEMGFDVVVHADQLNASGGTELALKISARSVDHAVYLESSTIKKLAASETTAVLLPGAEAYLNLPMPPARALIDQGARVALATDFNPGSCPSRSLSWIGMLARHQMKMSLAETIISYTLNGAYALGLQEELGALLPGRFADFVVLDKGRCWRQLFCGVGDHPVGQVWKSGSCVVG